MRAISKHCLASNNLNKGFLRFVIILMSFSFVKQANATHAAGGELLYEFVSGNTYRFTFKFYRDCTGVAAPLAVDMCYMNSCNVTSPITVSLFRVAGPILVGGNCPDIVSNCTSPNGLPSYEEYIYEGTITLTEPCNAWRFWVNIAARNPMNFLVGNNNVNLYVETTFNNTITNQDNSPTFNRLPVPYCCLNTPFTYDNGASDVDGDSLVYESIMPREHMSNFNCSGAPPSMCAYPVFVPPLNFTTNPLPCNNTFSIDSNTGLFSMIPSLVGKGVIAIKVSQYRNGQLLGYIVRDIQTIVLTCNISSPVVLVDTNSLSNSSAQNDTITACAGSSFSFCFTTQTNDTTSALSLQDNASSFSSPVSLVHGNQFTDSVYSCFNWTSSLTDTGWHFLNVLIIDSICRPIGVLSTDSLTKTYAIYIAPIDTTTITTSICEPSSFLGYFQSGVYVDTFTNLYGCDSFRILNLTVNPIVFATDSNTICAPNSYLGYSQSGTYVDTLVNQLGCDSIRTLNLVVNPTFSNTINQTICEPSSFLGYSQTGTYTDTFTSITGCDSFRILNLVVNPIVRDTIVQSICAPDSFLGYGQSGIYIDSFTSSVGCDSLRILDLQVNSVTTQTLVQSICAPGSFLGYSQSGTYIDTLTNANGCDSIRTLQLSVSPVVSQALTQTICAFDTFLGYNQSGTFIDTFISAQGCDSIRTLNLTVLPQPHDTVQIALCAPNTFQGYSQSGIYIDTFTAVTGCDSLRTLNLVINPNTAQTLTQTICANGSYLGYTQTGIYIDTLINQFGCDSIRTLNLTVNPHSDSTVNLTICQPNNYQGYSASGTYIDTLVNALGCDSIRTLNLVVHPITTSTVNQTICQPASFLGYSVSGTFIDTLVNQFSCDSIRTLNLIVNPITFSTINQSICEFDSFLGYSASGTYIDTLLNANGCDSVRTLNLTVNVRSFSLYDSTICFPANVFGYGASGIYSDTLVNAAGCDSIRTLNLRVNQPSDTIITAVICADTNFLGYNQSGTFLDTFTNAANCDSIRTLNLTVHPTYYLDTIIYRCFGDSIFAGGSWQTTVGVYWDSLTSINGCDSVTKTTFSLQQDITPNLGPDQESCVGQSVRLTPGGFNYYLWNDGDTNGVKEVSVAGQYIVRVADFDGCYGYDTVNISTFNPPLVSILYQDSARCIGEEIALKASGASNYEWRLPSDGSFYFTKDSIVKVQLQNASEIIQLSGWNIESCVDTSLLTIFSTVCCGNIVLPNAFTPNGDGRNDDFGLLSQGQFFKQFIFQVYNRWGQRVFKTNDPSLRWNGLIGDKNADIGTYFYTLKVQCFESDEIKNIRGDITLIR